MLKLCRNSLLEALCGQGQAEPRAGINPTLRVGTPHDIYHTKKKFRVFTHFKHDKLRQYNNI